MDKFEILKSFASMQGNSSIAELYKHNNITLVFCEGNSEVWWNYALVDELISEEELGYIEDFFWKRGRISSVYFSDDEKNGAIVDFLKGKGYEIRAKDSMLFWNKGIPYVESSGIIEVETDEEFDRWIETFIKSYPKDDPKNPYGEQTGFAEVLKKAWHGKKTENDRYYLAFKDDLPVAVVILTSYNGIGYISGVGSVPSVRGEGYGKKISLHCVSESFKVGNKHHFLATEEGHYPYEFYKKIGFDPEFVAFLYSKDRL